MYFQPARLFFALFAILIGPIFAEPVSATDKSYDVSYVWNKDAEAAQEYRQQVARILGPAVAKDLRVVADGGLHGVIYLRHGDSAGALRVARVHSRLLSKKGLDAAAPVLSKDWIMVADDRQKKKTRPQQALVKSSEPPVADPPKPRPPTQKSHRVRDLEAAVEAYIKDLRRKGRISKDERTGWSVYDFTTGEKLVTINEEIQFQAASLIKPFIAAAFFHRVKKKELIYGPRSRRHMERMIHYPNNPSTNWVIRQVGGTTDTRTKLSRHIPRHQHRRIHSGRRKNLPQQGLRPRLQSLPVCPVERQDRRCPGDQASDVLAGYRPDLHRCRIDPGWYPGVE